MVLSLLEGVCRSEVVAISRLPFHSYGKTVREGAGGDSTKMIDLVAEEAAISYLKSAGFSGRILSEELGEKRFGSSDYPLLVLDPVDGTTNATRGINFYSISVAASSGPRLSDVFAGVVMELPSRRIFAAELGKGAFLEGLHIGVGETVTLEEALIGVDLNIKGQRERVSELVELCVRARLTRNLGTAAMGLCYAANGALDLYLDNRHLLRVTDVAGAYAILKEAGASVLDMNGKDLDCSLNLKERLSLIAGPKKLCNETLSLLSKSRTS